MSRDPAAAKEALELEVYRDRGRVGTLSRTAHGASFVYDRSYCDVHRAEDRIAFTLPVREEAFEVRGTNLHPFFAGLLPEGLRLRALVRAVKTSQDDLYSLLVAAGANTVGDVWVKSVAGGLSHDRAAVDVRELEQQSFGQLLAQSLGWSADGDLVTVAGIQPKVSAGMISLPMRSRSRRHEYILKLSPPEYPKLVENECFFMQLAKAMRLSTAEVRLVHDREGAAGLLVERFDRVQRATDNTAPLMRIHQEDACQLLGRYPADKYRLSLREIAESLEVCSAPMVERLRLVQLQALSYLIGNGDLHGKNISVQAIAGRIQLTPIYDLLSTLPYGDRNLAIKIEGRDKNLGREDFIAFGERIGLRRPATVRMLAALIKGVGPCVARLPEIGLAEREERQMARAIEERLRRLEG